MVIRFQINLPVSVPDPSCTSDTDCAGAESGSESCLDKTCQCIQGMRRSAGVCKWLTDQVCLQVCV